MTTTLTPPKNQVTLISRLVLSASAGCIASTFCHPLDVVRVQMQTAGAQYSSPFDATYQIFKRGGMRTLWGGLSAAYLRQFTYSAFRMAVFSYTLEAVKHKRSSLSRSKEKKLPLEIQLALGAFAGITGSIIGNPAELALVRMAYDSKLPLDQQRNYKTSLHACARIFHEEGLQGLWRGVINSSLRAAVVNSFQLGIYGPTKQKLVEYQPTIFISTSNLFTMFVGANISAFCAIGASMPFDVVKSRLMSMAIVHGQSPKYTGMIDCFSKIFQQNGIFIFWRGFLPAFVKLAPYTVISFTALETLTKISGKSSAF